MNATHTIFRKILLLIAFVVVGVVPFLASASPAHALRPGEGIMSNGNAAGFTAPYGCTAGDLKCSIPIAAPGGPWMTWRYVCDGKVSVCLQNEDKNATIANGISSIGVYRTDPGCGKTIQIDVLRNTNQATCTTPGVDCYAGSWIVYYTGDCVNSCPAETTPAPPKFTSPANNTEVVKGSQVTLQWSAPGGLSSFALELYPSRHPKVDLTSVGGYYNANGTRSSTQVAYASSSKESSNSTTGPYYAPFMAFDVKTFVYRDYAIPESNHLVNTRTGWWGTKKGSQAAGEWLAYKFEIPTVVRFLQFDQYNSPATRVKDVAFEGSMNGSTWTVIKEFRNFATQASGEVLSTGDLDSANNTAYLAYRVRALTGTDSDIWGVLDMDLKGPDNVAPVVVNATGTSYSFAATSDKGYYAKIYGSKAGQCRPLWTNGTSLTVRTKPATPTPTPSPTPAPVGCKQTCDPQAGINCQTGFICAFNTTTKTSSCHRENAGCTYTAQNAQCNCPTPSPSPTPVVGPVCGKLTLSGATSKIGGAVSLACDKVTNAQRYEFRVAYHNPASTENSSTLTWAALNASSATANTSVSYTTEKPGKYIFQCRPCGANNTCAAWEAATTLSDTGESKTALLSFLQGVANTVQSR